MKYVEPRNKRKKKKKRKSKDNAASPSQPGSQGELKDKHSADKEKKNPHSAQPSLVRNLLSILNVDELIKISNMDELR